MHSMIFNVWNEWFNAEGVGPDFMENRDQPSDQQR